MQQISYKNFRIISTDFNEKSNGVKQTKMTTFFTIVEQNAEKTGPSDQKFSKSPLKELDEALELLSD